VTRVSGRGTRRERTDRGSGTALAIALISIVALAAAVVGLSAAAHTAGVRAQGVADVAALAAAVEARDLRARGMDTARVHERVCATAADVASRNGARLAECFVDSGGAVTVYVEVTQGAWTAVRGARAGTSDKKEPGGDTG